MNNKEFVGGSILLMVSALVLFVDNFTGFLMQVVVLIVTVVLYAKTWVPIIQKVMQKTLRR